MDDADRALLLMISTETAHVGGWIAMSEDDDRAARRLMDKGYLTVHPLKSGSKISVYSPSETGDAVLRQMVPLAP